MGQLFKLKNGTVLLSTEAPGGVYNSGQLKKIAELCSKELAVVKATEDQRLALFVKESEVQQVAQQLRAIGLGFRHYQDGLHQPVSCLGELCEEHEQPALHSAMELTKEIASISIESTLKIGINGCARCCISCHTLDVSVVGDSSGYRISLGGKTSQLPQLSSFFAEGVPAKELPRLLKNVVQVFKDQAEPGESLHDLIERKGVESFVKALAPYSQDAAHREDPFAGGKAQDMAAASLLGREDLDLHADADEWDQSEALSEEVDGNGSGTAQAIAPHGAGQDDLEEIPIDQGDDASLDDDLSLDDIKGEVGLDPEQDFTTDHGLGNDLTLEDEALTLDGPSSGKPTHKTPGSPSRQAPTADVPDDEELDTLIEDDLSLEDLPSSDAKNQAYRTPQENEQLDHSLDITEEELSFEGEQDGNLMSPDEERHLQQHLDDAGDLGLEDDDLGQDEDITLNDASPRLKTQDDELLEDIEGLHVEEFPSSANPGNSQAGLMEDEGQDEEIIDLESSRNLGDDILVDDVDTLDVDRLDAQDDSLVIAEDDLLEQDELQPIASVAKPRPGSRSSQVSSHAEDDFDLDLAGADDSELEPLDLEDDSGLHAELELAREEQVQVRTSRADALDPDQLDIENSSGLNEVGLEADESDLGSSLLSSDDELELPEDDDTLILEMASDDDLPELDAEIESIDRQPTPVAPTGPKLASQSPASKTAADSDFEDDLHEDVPELSDEEESSFEQKLHASIEEESRLLASAETDPLENEREQALSLLANEETEAFAEEPMEEITSESPEEFEDSAEEVAKALPIQSATKKAAKPVPKGFRLASLSFENEHLRVGFDSGAYIDFDLSSLREGEEKSFSLGEQQISVTIASDGYMLEIDGLRMFCPKSAMPAA